MLGSCRELFVRNSFAPLDKALEDIEMVVVGDNLVVMDQLQHLDYTKAGCFDPSMPTNTMHAVTCKNE